MRILTVIAAAMSVLLVPVVSILISHSHADIWASAATIADLLGAGVGILTSFLFSTFTYLFSSEREQTRRILRVIVEKDPIRIKPSFTISSHAPIVVQLAFELDSIEQEGKKLLHKKLLNEEPSVSVIRVRSRLYESGVWSKRDLYDFDIALRTRNEVAHGDYEKLSKASLINAVATMRRLRRKLESSQLQEST